LDSATNRQHDARALAREQTHSHIRVGNAGDDV
jgi:hypothetical protein